MSAYVLAGAPDVLLERRQGVPAFLNDGIGAWWSTGDVLFIRLQSEQVQDRCDAMLHGFTLILIPLNLPPKLIKLGLVADPGGYV